MKTFIFKDKEYSIVATKASASMGFNELIPANKLIYETKVVGETNIGFKDANSVYLLIATSTFDPNSNEPIHVKLLTKYALKKALKEKVEATKLEEVGFRTLKHYRHSNNDAMLLSPDEFRKTSRNV